MNRSLAIRALITTFLCFCLSSLLSAQVAEICNNGIDDDLDGLIDCNDPDCSGFPVPQAGYFHTGKNGNGGILPSGAQDIDWDVSINGPGGPFNPAIVLGAPATNPYAPSPWPDAQWISTNVNAADNSQFFINGNFVYYYRIQFFLPCVNACSTSVPANFCINMSFMVDNFISAILVNGVADPGVPAGGFGGFSPGSEANINLCNNFQAGLNTVMVEVVSPSGLAAFLAQTNVNAPPPPVPPVITPVSGIICSNQGPVTVSADTPGGTWSASCGSCIDPVSGAFDPVSSGSGTFDIYYSVQNGNTCGSDTISLNVLQAPTVDAGPDTSVCPGDPVTLSASGADTYNWSNGLSNGTTFVPPATSTYTVIGTHSNSCQDTDQVTVTINPLGCPNFPNTHNCDINQIRQAFVAAGCIEMASCVSSCSMYFLNPQSMSGSQAQAFAQNLGANLVSIQSAAENQCLISALNNMGQSGVIWIGFNDEQVENNFVWYDQSPVIYTNWAPGEPNNLNGENCTQIYPDGMWNDLDCNTANAQSVIEVSLCPVVDAGADTGICPGATATLNASNALFGSTPYAYAWNNGINTQPNPVAPAASSSYSVTVTDRYQCSTSDTVQVTVYALPPVDAGPDTALCAGASLSLSGSGAQTYAWDNGISDATPFTPSATSTYTLTGTDTNTCQNTDQVTITVNPLPAVDAGPDQTICAGDSVTLAGSGAQTYTWNNGISDAIPFIPASTSTYILTGTDSNGCQNTDSISLTVTPLPATPLISAGSDFCQGDAVVLDALSINGAQYFWSNGTFNEDLSFSSINLADSGTYSVYAVASNCTSATAQHTLNVHPNFAPVIPASICSGSVYTFAGNTYQAAGQYQVPFSTVYGCDSTITIQLSLLPQPVADFEMPAEIYLSEPVIHVVSTASNASVISYLLSSGETYNTPDFAHYFSQEGTYSIIQTAENGPCSDTRTREIIVHPDSPPYIPNAFTPNNDGTNDEWKPVIAFLKDYSLIIFDRWGERLFESQDVYTGWNGSWWNNPDRPLAQGTYVYRISYVDYTGKKHDIIGSMHLIR